MSAVKSLHHVNVLVDDLQQGVAFYHGLLGLPLDETPDHDFPSQFFRLSNGTQIHMNEYRDEKPFRAHFCIVVEDFSEIFRRMKQAGVIDIAPWGKVRRLVTGSMQMFVRDPSGNLVEIASRPSEIISDDILTDDLVDASDGNQLFHSGRNEHRRGA